MAKAAHSKELKAAFVKHEKETRGQVKRLEQVFKIFGKKPQAKKCEAIMGITKEGAEIMADVERVAKDLEGVGKVEVELDRRAHGAHVTRAESSPRAP